jgi:hypothetical protein
MDFLIISYMANLFKWANVFISFFIILIAYSFFQRTKPHNNRTPWIILFVAVITFFIFETSNALFPNLNPVLELRDFFKTLFVAFILYVFVYERYLIEHSRSIVIEKKDEEAKNNNPPIASPVVSTDLSKKEIIKPVELTEKKEKSNEQSKEVISKEVLTKKVSADVQIDEPQEKYVDPEFLPPREPAVDINPNDPLLRVTLKEEAPVAKKQVKKSKPIKKKKPSKK